MTLPKSIFVVVGSSSEDPPLTEWIIAAYITKEEADQHRDLAAAIVREYEKSSWRKREEGIKNPYDNHPDIQMDYTGTTYFVNEVKLFVHVDEFLAQEPTTIS